MKINKDKIKKVGKVVFGIMGGLAIVFIALFLAAFTIASWRERLIDYNVSYEDEGYGEETPDPDSLSSVTSLAGDEREESLIEKTEGNDFSESESTTEIKTGALSMISDDLDIAIEEFQSIKDKYSGSITYSYESGDGVGKYITMILKIEVDYFEEAFEEISEIEGEVEYSYTDTNDVTEQYTDLQSRLKNLNAVEVQLLEIMETAETVEDTLAVYSELSSTRSQIEVLEGQIIYLDNQTDYSYITVTFLLSSTGADIAEDEWKPLGVAKDAFRSFISTVEGLANFLIWILVFSPIGIIICGIYWLINRKTRKSKK